MISEVVAVAVVSEVVVMCLTVGRALFELNTVINGAMARRMAGVKGEQYFLTVERRLFGGR